MCIENDGDDQAQGEDKALLNRGVYLDMAEALDDAKDEKEK
jgi:hypothetical protein